MSEKDSVSKRLKSCKCSLYRVFALVFVTVMAVSAVLGTFLDANLCQNKLNVLKISANITLKNGFKFFARIAKKTSRDSLILGFKELEVLDVL